MNQGFADKTLEAASKKNKGRSVSASARGGLGVDFHSVHELVIEYLRNSYHHLLPTSSKSSADPAPQRQQPNPDATRASASSSAFAFGSNTSAATSAATTKSSTFSFGGGAAPTSNTFSAASKPGFGSSFGALAPAPAPGNSINYVDHDDDNEPVRASSPSLGQGGSGIDEGFRTVHQFDNVVVYQKNTDQEQAENGHAFRAIAKGTLLLQTSTTDPKDSRMVLRHKGLKVLVNMKIQGNYSYASRTNKKGTTTTFGQIGFVGCNSAAEGARPFFLKAAPEAETAQPLHRALQRLAGGERAAAPA
jgi:hypothetical protein